MQALLINMSNSPLAEDCLQAKHKQVRYCLVVCSSAVHQQFPNLHFSLFCLHIAKHFSNALILFRPTGSATDANIYRFAKSSVSAYQSVSTLFTHTTTPPRYNLLPPSRCIVGINIPSLCCRAVAMEVRESIREPNVLIPSCISWPVRNIGALQLHQHYLEPVDAKECYEEAIFRR